MPVLFLLAVLTAGAGESPRAVVEEFFTLQAAGDIDRAAALWTPQAAPAFVRANARSWTVRCRRIERIGLRVVHEDATSAVIEADTILSSWTAMSGSRERFDTARTRFTLHHEGDGWRIASVNEEIVSGAALARQAVSLLNNVRYADAAEFIARGKEIAAANGDAAAESLLLGVESSHTALTAKDYGTAVRQARESVAVAEAVGDAEILGRSLIRLQRALERSGDTTRSPALERVLSLEPFLEDLAILALATSSEARRESALSNHRSAFRYAEMTVRYAEASGDPAARVSAALNFGGEYLLQGDNELALVHLRRAADVAMAAGFRSSAALALVNIAFAEARSRNHGEAICAINAAMELARPEGKEAEGLMLFRRAQMHLSGGHVEAAEADVAAAQPWIADDATRYSIAVFMEQMRLYQGRHEEVIEWADRARSLAAKAGLSHEGDGYEASALRRLGRAEEALQMLRARVDAIERERDKTTADARQLSLYIERRVGNYMALIDLLLECGAVEEALRVAERWKGRVLRDAVAQRADRDAAATPLEEEQKARLDARIRTLNQRLLRPSLPDAELEALRHELAGARIALHDFRARSTAALTLPVPAAERKPDAEWPEALRDAVVLDYVVSDEQTIVFAVRADAHGSRAVTVRVLPIGMHDLNAHIARAVEAIERRDLAWPAIGRRLYDILLRPVERELAGARSVCIIPHDHLWRVPFHALLAADGKALVERLPVFYLPSMAVADHAPPRDESKDRVELVAFANPLPSTAGRAQHRAVFRDVPLAALPDAETEVEALARIYGREQSRIYSRAEALESTLKRAAPHCRILHVATHGIEAPDAPMFSSLLLAGGTDDAEDGLLEAREIAELRMDADLAVLSACDTARGQIRRGEGVMGMAWAFLAAGCRGTVVSQWKADSKATARLMIAFHRHLSTDKTPAEALRLAQLELMQERRYHHPLYWAPFVVVGVGRR